METLNPMNNHIKEYKHNVSFDELTNGNMNYDDVLYDLVLYKIDNINRQISEYYHTHIKPNRYPNNRNNDTRYNKSPKNTSNRSPYSRSPRNSTSSPSEPTTSKYKLGLTALKAKSDPIKLELTQALNKLAEDTVKQSVDDIREAINKSTDKKKYLDMLWNMLFNKMHTQSNFLSLHISFIQETLMHSELCELHTHMMTLLNESLNMLQDEDYFVDGTTNLLTMVTSLGVNIMPFVDDTDSTANEYGQDTQKLEILYNMLGKLSAAFMANSKSDKNRLLVALYKNFQHMNNLLLWQPINMVELNARLYYIIGFFTDNRVFIKSMARDYYNDMECQLEVIKTQNIPSSVKYKIIDCIDNIVQMRLGTSSSNNTSKPKNTQHNYVDDGWSVVGSNKRTTTNNRSTTINRRRASVKR